MSHLNPRHNTICSFCSARDKEKQFTVVFGAVSKVTILWLHLQMALLQLLPETTVVMISVVIPLTIYFLFCTTRTFSSNFQQEICCWTDCLLRGKWNTLKHNSRCDITDFITFFLPYI